MTKTNPGETAYRKALKAQRRFAPKPERGRFSEKRKEKPMPEEERLAHLLSRP
jgi:hypothetical protein